jgi:hypothetical protein
MALYSRFAVHEDLKFNTYSPGGESDVYEVTRQ